MIEFQRLLLADTVRNKAFKKALEQVIVPGESIVADIGSGTGYLSFLASKLGAKKCHLYEFSEALSLSKELAKANGIKNCVFHHKHSTDEKKPPKVDIVISETLGNYALEENILETLRDAQRFLRPGGVMIPQSLTQSIAPVTHPRLYEALDVWDDLDDLDFSRAREISLNNIYVKTIHPSDLPKDAECVRRWDALDFREDNDSIREATVRWPFSAPATIYGFALWWDCDLLPGIRLSTSPYEPATHWEQLFLPLLNPIDVRAGQEIELFVHSDTRYQVKVRLQWEAGVVGEKKQKMDMWKGNIA